MPDSPATPATIWNGWMNEILETVRHQINSAAVRHRAMAGQCNTYTVMWLTTGQREASGLFTAMEAASGTDISGIDGLVTFIEQLPEPARTEIITAFASKQPQA